MKSIFRLSLLIISLYLFLPLNTFACFRKPIIFFSPNYDQFLFDGKVIGYTKAYKSKFFKGEAVGVQVSVGEFVNLPEKVKIVEVFPFDTESDCNRFALNQKTVQKRFPLNIKVRVVASKIANGFFELTDMSAVQLDAFIQDESIQTAKNKNFPFTINSIVNYKLLPKNWLEGDNLDDYDSFDSRLKYNLLNFEIKKELFRLDRIKSESEAFLNLKRLIYFPDYWQFQFDEIVKRYLTNSEKAEELIRLRNNWVKQ